MVIGAISGGVWNTAAVNTDAVAGFATRLSAPPFDTVRHSFLPIRIDPVNVDDENDAAFSSVIANFERFARAAATMNAKGVLLDTQTYQVQVFSFPDVGRGRPFFGVQQSLKRRGAQVMQAMLSAFPNIVVVVTIGYAEVWRAACLDGVPLDRERYGLLPAFLDGMREALGEARSRQLVDGFLPSYATRSGSAFPLFRAAISFDESQLRAAAVPTPPSSYQYPRMMGAPDLFPWVVRSDLTCTPAERAQLERQVPVGFGLMIDFGENPFNSTDFGSNFHSPATFSEVASAAARNADPDGLVWLFSAQVDWWSRPGNTRLPQAYRAGFDPILAPAP
jgi:hypothetical protein